MLVGGVLQCTHPDGCLSVSKCVPRLLPACRPYACPVAPAAAPLLLTGVQFACQNVLARLVFASGLVQRVGERMTWRDWSRLGARSESQPRQQPSVLMLRPG